MNIRPVIPFAGYHSITLSSTDAKYSDMLRGGRGEETTVKLKESVSDNFQTHITEFLNQLPKTRYAPGKGFRIESAWHLRAIIGKPEPNNFSYQLEHERHVSVEGKLIPFVQKQPLTLDKKLYKHIQTWKTKHVGVDVNYEYRSNEIEAWKQADSVLAV